MKDKTDLPSATVPGFYVNWTVARIADWYKIAAAPLINSRLQCHAFTSHGRRAVVCNIALCPGFADRCADEGTTELRGFQFDLVHDMGFGEWAIKIHCSIASVTIDAFDYTEIAITAGLYGRVIQNLDDLEAAQGCGIRVIKIDYGHSGRASTD